MNGAIPDPTLAHIEEVPTATFRTDVGTSSAEYMNTTLKPGEMKKRPMADSVRLIHTNSED